MNKIKIIILSFSLFFLSSCMSVNASSQPNDNIITPKATKYSVQGTWEIVEKHEMSESSNGDTVLEIGQDIYIDPELVLIKKRYTTTPDFSSKYANGRNYFNFKYGSPEFAEKIADENVEIVSISDGERFYQDIILQDENTIIFVYSGQFYKAKKTSDTVEESLVTNYIALDREVLSGSKNLEKMDTSLLLGVRNTTEQNGKTVNTYYTYFIRKNEEGNITIYQTSNLFVPKQTSFWTVKYEQSYSGDENNKISAAEAGLVNDTKNILSSKDEMILTFLNPNYISFINQSAGAHVNDYNSNELENLTGNLMEVTDIGGANGLKVLTESLSKEAAGLGIEPAELKTNEEVQNIGIARENGKWIFVTNLHYEKEGIVKSKRVSLNILPNIDVDMDSEKNLSWTNIKNMVPNAIDAVSSPKEDLIVIQSPDELLVYSHEDTVYPLASIPIYGSNSIIMEEWATEHFSVLWEEAFKRTERIPVEYNINQ